MVHNILYQLHIEQKTYKILSERRYSLTTTLPDGQIITIGSEPIRCPEASFKPNFIGFEQNGLQKLASSNTTKYDLVLERYIMIFYLQVVQ